MIMANYGIYWTDVSLIFILYISDKLDRLKLQHIPSELKKELEKELEIVRTENIRLRDTLESMEVERKKWRVFFHFLKISLLFCFVHRI